MRNIDALLESEPELIAKALAVYGDPCIMCAYRFACEENEPHYNDPCWQGVLEWMMDETKA